MAVGEPTAEQYMNLHRKKVIALIKKAPDL